MMKTRLLMGSLFGMGVIVVLACSSSSGGSSANSGGNGPSGGTGAGGATASGSTLDGDTVCQAQCEAVVGCDEMAGLTVSDAQREGCVENCLTTLASVRAAGGAVCEDIFLRLVDCRARHPECGPTADNDAECEAIEDEGSAMCGGEAPDGGSSIGGGGAGGEGGTSSGGNMGSGGSVGAFVCMNNTVPCPDDVFVCISPEAFCDGTNDCSDGSDEVLENCQVRRCGSGSFWCGSDGECVPTNTVCDGSSDCADGSDEPKTCEMTCAELNGQWCVADSLCVQSSQICDTNIDCSDGSDEQDCETQCTENQGTWCAADGVCLADIDVCNGQSDCSDGSDEPGNCEAICGARDPQVWMWCSGSATCVFVRTGCG